MKSAPLPLFFILIFFLAIPFAGAQPVVYPARFTVAQDGSGDFKTVQEAVNAVHDLSQQRVTIYIKNGVYREKLVIPSWKTKIALVGQSRDSTIITGNDHTGKPFPGGNDGMGRPAFITYTSYTVLVQGHDFRAENLTIQNTAGRVGQAVALHVEGDRAAIINCTLLGHQDTLYTATGGSRQYYQNCFIEGTTDFIFGEATAVFQACTIRSLANSYITAAATPKEQRFGYVFFDCKLIAADTGAAKVFLGRPRRPHSKTVFIRTEMGSHILPQGWDNWRNPENEKTVFYAEYDSRGPGAVATRVAWSRKLSAKEVKQYTLKEIFRKEDFWLPE